LIGISKFNYWQMESEMLFTNCAQETLIHGNLLTVFLNSTSLL
jgi:hypothetical protein